MTAAVAQQQAEPVEATPQSSIRSSIDAIQAFASLLPQAQLDTLHFFASGMYARVLPRPAGTLIVGKVHKAEHFYIVAKGRVSVTDGDMPARVLEAGTVLVSKPGTKRAVLALEDAVCLTVHRTDEVDLDAIERELIEPDDAALFDARNELRRITQ